MSATNPLIGFVSLGCPKALVDSERILTHLRAEGYQFSQSYDGADLVIVNTCGFIDSARDESLNAIGKAMNENGKVIVMGCLGAEPDVIRDKFPNVLAITGPQKYESVLEAVHTALPPKHEPYVDLLPPGGIKLTPRHYAYLKISEGCNNRCKFCIIPALRGDLVSRPLGDVMMEAERLVQAGVREIMVISQDTSAYGLDLKYAPSVWRDREWYTRFYDLCDAMSDLGIWVRMHYVYPYPHVDDVIPMMAAGKILPYLDIPFQHASPTVLKSMRRPASSEKVTQRIHNWRDMCPDLAIRSTFIVGYPGETEDDFQYLLDWLSEVQLDRVGCFKYEAVKGAEANALPDPVSEEVKEERWHRFMAHQQQISASKMAQRVGQTLPVMLDIVENSKAQARTKYDAPEIDGVVKVSGLPKDIYKPGDIVNVMITKADEYDLSGKFSA